jgi:class 3 adenylate cyclase
VSLRVRVDRHRCIGAGNCITIAPTAFDWHASDYLKADVTDADSVDEEVLHEARLACPTLAIEIDDVQELLPWQLRSATAPTQRRVMKTFMFTDIVGSTQLVEAIGDEAWSALLRWHDEMLQSLVESHNGEVIDTAGDGWFIGFDSPDGALACAVAIQRRLAEHRKTSGFAPQLRIGVHASEATQTSSTFLGKGVHEAARIGALAGAGEILASCNTVDSTRYRTGEPREVTLKGIAKPVEVVLVDWQ